MRSGKIAMSIVLIAILIPIAVQAQTGPKIRSLAVLGKGIATSPDDPMDFMIAKFGIGEFSAGNHTFRTGVLILDDVKYKLRDINISDSRAIGNIYLNNSKIGSFDVSSVMKGDTEIWAGTLSLNEEKYNLYIIEGVRPIKASELKDKISEYCKNNPENQNCKKIKSYCENNPEDSRCKSLFREYCIKSGTKDIRCRQFLMSWCKKNPTNEHCVPFALQRAKHYCELHPDSKICKRIANRVVDFCKAHPENKGCLKVKRIIIERPKLFHGYKIRKSLMNIGSEVTKGNETTVLKSARGPLR